jgi:hypothetical protein
VVIFRFSPLVYTTGLCINFSLVLKTIAILVRKCLPVPILGLNLAKWHYLKISEEMQLSLVQYFYKLPQASSKIVVKICCSPVLLQLPGHNMKIVSTPRCPAGTACLLRYSNNQQAQAIEAAACEKQLCQVPYKHASMQHL